nr:hypothetical protein CFP56_62107 [Quercus suber]
MTIRYASPLEQKTAHRYDPYCVASRARSPPPVSSKWRQVLKLWSSCFASRESIPCRGSSPHTSDRKTGRSIFCRNMESGMVVDDNAHVKVGQIPLDFGAEHGLGRILPES